MANRNGPDLPEQLRQAIEASGKSHRELGAEADVDPSQINRFMLGDRDLRLATAGAICDVLGLSLLAQARGRGRPAKRTKSQRAGNGGSAPAQGFAA